MSKFLLRRSVLSLLILLVALLAISDTASAKPKDLTPAQLALLAKAEASFNRIQTMAGRFVQSSSNGELSEGTVYLSKPGRLRIEYDPPVPILIVANGSYFTFVDQELKQLSYLDLDSSPAGLLLRKDLDFTNGDLQVLRVDEDAGSLIISVVSRKDPTIGRLSLVFTTKPFAFRQWQVTDAQGITTIVTLQNMETGVRLDSKLFETPDRY